MIHPTAQSSATPAAESGAVTNLVGRAVQFNWRRCLTMWMFVMQYTLLFCHIWPAIVPESSHGILTLAQRDLRLAPSVMVVLFLFGIGISWRGVRARWWLLAMLIGQGVLAVLATLYAVRGESTWTQVAGHGGLFVLSTVAILALIQRESSAQWHLWRLRIDTQAFLIPIIGATLMLYALGLAARPDAGVAMFIRSQFGAPLILMLVAAFAVAGGVVIQNHISAGRLFVALVPQAIYAAMAVSFLGADNDVSMGGVVVHMLFTVTALFIVLIQTKEYARAVVRRQRGAP